MTTTKHLFALAAAVLSLCSIADAQWVINPANKHLYQLNKTKMTWKLAEARAVTLGGHLVTIRNKAERDWIDRTFGKAQRWIGFTDERVEGKWEWTSGEPVTFTGWCGTYPHSNDSRYDHADIAAHGCWENDHPISLFESIIEFAPKAGFSVFGKGCASTATLPTMVSTSTPKVGQQFKVDISGFLPKLQFGQLMLGVSNTSWGFIPLPWDLTILGMGGCNLLVSHDFSGTIVTSSKGSVSLSFAIPVDPKLYGSTIYAQAWMPDAKANALGVATSNAFKARIGL